MGHTTDIIDWDKSPLFKLFCTLNFNTSGGGWNIFNIFVDYFLLLVFVNLFLLFSFYSFVFILISALNSSLKFINVHISLRATGRPLSTSWPPLLYRIWGLTNDFVKVLIHFLFIKNISKKTVCYFPKKFRNTTIYYVKIVF